MYVRGVGRWFGKGGLYRSIGKGSMISVYKIESSYVTIRKHRGGTSPGAPMVPTPMYVPEFMPHMNRPMMNIAGWTANDCKITARPMTRLLSNMVYFLKETGIH